MMRQALGSFCTFQVNQASIGSVFIHAMSVYRYPCLTNAMLCFLQLAGPARREIQDLDPLARQHRLNGILKANCFRKFDV